MTQEKIKLKKWDIANCHKTEEDINGFLEASIEEAGDDQEYMAHVLGVVSRARGMAKVAKKAKLSSAALSNFFSKTGSGEFISMLQIINALGLKLKMA